MKIIITIDTNPLDGVGAVIHVNPGINVLEQAAGVDKLTVAETYALGALNTLKKMATATGGGDLTALATTGGGGGDCLGGGGLLQK